jgi:hypothetical protein
VTEQTSDKPWKLPLPTHSLTHTFIATDRLVFNNQFTYVHGGFFLDYQGSTSQGICGGVVRYLGITDYNDYLTVIAPIRTACSTSSRSATGRPATTRVR